MLCKIVKRCKIEKCYFCVKQMMQRDDVSLEVENFQESVPDLRLLSRKIAR